MAPVVSPPSQYLAKLAVIVGATEPALRLLISILVGYPLGVIHRNWLYGKEPVYQHLFFVTSGLLIGYFNYGGEVLHSIVTVLGVYLILYLIGGTIASVIMVLVFTMSYLLIGYYVTGTETYDIKWSMPQCVLTLRLIGLAFDIHDGQKPRDQLSADMKKTALVSTPSLLEVAAHTYFPASFLVGPQFPMRRYLDLVEGKLRAEETGGNAGILPDCLTAGFKRGCLGFLYLGVFQVGTSYFPDSYLLSPQYDSLPFYQRCLVMGLWGKITLYKYISCWLISEGVCIVTGLTYNGKDQKTGATRWDGCANVKLAIFEGATEFGHYIASFNTNTNTWLAQYIYKRLKFMNNRYISQGAALLFLAVWHGLHSGYYVCFLMEFIVMYLEKDLESILVRSPKANRLLANPYVRPVKWAVLKVYTFVFMGYCLVPFALLSYHRWWHVYKSVYFAGHLLFGLWPLYSIGVRKLLVSPAAARAARVSPARNTQASTRARSRTPPPHTRLPPPPAQAAPTRTAEETPATSAQEAPETNSDTGRPKVE